MTTTYEGVQHPVEEVDAAMALALAQLDSELLVQTHKAVPMSTDGKSCSKERFVPFSAQEVYRNCAGVGRARRWKRLGEAMSRVGAAGEVGALLADALERFGLKRLSLYMAPQWEANDQAGYFLDLGLSVCGFETVGGVVCEGWATDEDIGAFRRRELIEQHVRTFEFELAELVHPSASETEEFSFSIGGDALAALKADGSLTGLKAFEAFFPQRFAELVSDLRRELCDFPEPSVLPL
jgi:hypothetical protein